MTYQDICSEIEKVCRVNPDCLRMPAAEVDCPYVDVCNAQCEGLNSGTAAFEAAMVARYKELKAGTKYGISILPDDCQAYADGYRYGAYKQTPGGETRVVEFFKTKDEIQTFVDMNPLYRKRKGRDL